MLSSEFVQRPAGSVLGSYWDDPNDFRGSEVMVQRDYFTPSGKKWSEVKKEVKASVSGIYILDVKGLHGKKNTEVVKKKGFKAWVEKLQEKAGAKPIK